MIDGPRARGKTETARQHAASGVLLDIDPYAADAVLIDPGLLIEGAAPRPLDEWQTHPLLWTHVR